MDSDDTKKSNRQMTPEMLEKLAVAREKANKVHSDRAAIKRKEKELKDKMWTDRKQKLEQVEEPVVKTKKTKKKTARTPGRKPGRKPASAGGNFSKLSTEDRAAELQRREHSIRSLERKRAKLLAQLEEVERELSVSGGLFGAGAGVGGRRRRPRNKPLATSIA